MELPTISYALMFLCFMYLSFCAGVIHGETKQLDYMLTEIVDDYKEFADKLKEEYK